MSPNDDPKVIGKLANLRGRMQAYRQAYLDALEVLQRATERAATAESTADEDADELSQLRRRLHHEIKDHRATKAAQVVMMREHQAVVDELNRKVQDLLNRCAEPRSRS